MEEAETQEILWSLVEMKQVAAGMLSYSIIQDVGRARFGEPFSAEQPSVMPSALAIME